MRKAQRTKLPFVASIVVLATLWCGFDAAAQVRSVTLGIRTHCPYGIRGCWPEIRDGLETPKVITSISEEPDIKTDTCEVKMREDWTADPDMFQRNFLEMRIGVDVRGVEAVVDGRIEMQGTNLVLRVSGTETVMHLIPLKQKVQWDKQRQQPAAATSAEKKAFADLASRVQKLSGPVRIIGPLRNASSADQTHRVLEVRTFEILKDLSARKA